MFSAWKRQKPHRLQRVHSWAVLHFALISQCRSVFCLEATKAARIPGRSRILPSTTDDFIPATHLPLYSPFTIFRVHSWTVLHFALISQRPQCFLPETGKSRTNHSGSIPGQYSTLTLISQCRSVFCLETAKAAQTTAGPFLGSTPLCLDFSMPQCFLPGSDKSRTDPREVKNFTIHYRRFHSSNPPPLI